MEMKSMVANNLLSLCLRSQYQPIESHFWLTRGGSSERISESPQNQQEAGGPHLGIGRVQGSSGKLGAGTTAMVFRAGIMCAACCHGEGEPRVSFLLLLDDSFQGQRVCVIGQA